MVSHRAQAAGPRQCEELTVAIFTTTGCPYCRKAKGIFQEEGIAYKEVDVSSDARLRQELEGVTGQKTVPQASRYLPLWRFEHVNVLLCTCASRTTHQC